MTLQSRLWAISLVVLGSAATLTTHTVHSQNVSPQNPSSTLQSHSSVLQSGVNRVTFQSEGETLVGNLYLPASYKSGDKLPAVVVSGAWITVKEQMAGLYARKLSEQGFAALAFDSRYYGESGGTPRQLESPTAKVQDIKNSITYLTALPAVDGDRISGLGVCFGAGYMAKVATEDPHLKSFATVADWMYDAETLDRTFTKAVIEQRMQSGLAAQQQYKQTGEVVTVPAFSTEENPIVAMTGEPIYYGNPERGSIPEWKNQFAVMSWVNWIKFDAMALAPEVKAPAPLIHSDGSALPENVKQFYNELPGSKKLVWLEGNHFDFYDQELQVNQTVQAAADFFLSTSSKEYKI